MKDFFKAKIKMQKKYQEQLRYPKGDMGRVVGGHMFEGNADIIERIIQEIQSQNDMTIIDVGVGPGYSLKLLSERFPNADIIGIDPFDEMLAYATKNVLNSIDSSKVRVLKGQTPNLPLKNDTADYVLLINMVYFWENPINEFKDIKRTLKSQGKLLLYFTGPEGIAETIEDEGVFYKHSEEEIIGLLRNAGFVQIKSVQYRRKLGQIGYIISATKE